jgi:2-keto-3-deoxy-galactonokinase
MKAIGKRLDPSKKTPVLICGMAGSRQGWSEAPYISTPCKPPDLRQAIFVNSNDKRISVKILPGIKQNEPADIMRGEETQITGILNKNKNFEGGVCLPGTHTKGVRVSAGEVVNFQTFMTGEIFSLLSEKSVLKHSVSKEGWVEKNFRDSVKEIISENKLLGAKLFNLRAESIMKKLSLVDSRTRRSGYLIGLELAGSRPYWWGENVLVIGEEEISLAYEQGLNCQGVIVDKMSAKEVSLKG